MGRQREKFERTDVPTPSHTRNVISAAVIVAVFIAVFVGVSHAWRRASSYSAYNDADLENAIDSQDASIDIAGYMASPDDITTILVLAEGTDGTLASARIVALDETSATSAVAEVPTDLVVTTEAGTLTLSALYQESGGAACIVPASTALGIDFTHALIAKAGFWDAFSAYSAAGGDGTAVREAAVSDISNRKIDETLQEMVDCKVADALAAPVQYAVNTQDLGDAGTNSTVDAAQLNVALGLYVVA